MGGSEHTADAAVSACWTIIGQGLAGTCLAWDFWFRGVEFHLVDREMGGSSRVAAGLVNPITGKNFEPTARIAEFLPKALSFYSTIEHTLKIQVWYPLPILRLADRAAEWAKMLGKTTRPDVACWLAGEATPRVLDGWYGALELTGGGRLDVRHFLDASRDFFHHQGVYQKAEIDITSTGTRRIWCEGAAGLIRGRYGNHRCAKGEILTVHAADWPESHIHIGAGGWLVPIGERCFKVGSTYEWDQLDECPSSQGREKVLKIARRLGGNGDFAVIAHEAGIRPILRRSEALIGPLAGGDWMFNALGSKGSLFAPGMAQRLARWILDGAEPESSVQFLPAAE